MFFDIKKNRDWAENLQILSQIGLTMAGCITFCFFVGRYLDKWLELKGVFTTVFIIFGVIGGANVVYRQIMKITQVDNEAETEKPKEDLATLRKKYGIGETPDDDSDQRS